MNIEYSGYLLSIILIIAFISLGLVFIFKRIGRHSKKGRPVQPVKGGNVSVFFDKAGNVTIIPYVKDKYGSGKATAGVEFIKAPYAERKLGEIIRKSMNSCINSEPCESRELLGKLQSYDWAQFSEGKRNISVYFRQEYGIVFNTTRRKSNGAYEFNNTGVEKSLPADTEDDTLGITLLQLLQRCK
jgi:hypothetical protein